ncbi:MAG TPA: DUF5753 domain-containing protein [Pseudonocardia sp.]|jgi:hypothetical protein
MRPLPPSCLELDTGLVQMEAEARRLACWQPAMKPGLVQTPAYARELLSRPGRPSMAGLSEEDIEALIVERIRRQEVLYAPGKQIELYIGEAALRTAPGTVDTLLGQLDRLATLAGLGAVEVGVIPFPAMPIMPLCSF